MRIQRTKVEILLGLMVLLFVISACSSTNSGENSLHEDSLSTVSLPELKSPHVKKGVTEDDLSLKYYEDSGVPNNYREAVLWFTEAAEKGDASAQFSLAFMYKKGRGVPINYKKAVKWFTKAAEQGDAESQLALGLMYANGQGVPRNYKFACIWSGLAVISGNESAKKTNDMLIKFLSPRELQEAQKTISEKKVEIDLRKK